MSRIGNLPVPVPKGVTVAQSGTTISAKGPKGNLSMAVPDFVTFDIGADEVVVTRANDSKPARARHGLGRALLNSMVVGVSTGFTRKLDIVGVGYKAELKGRTLVMHLGYSHPIEFEVPDLVTVTVEKGTSLLVSGIDKQQVGQVAAVLRGYRAPDAYKGKGVRYSDEQIRLKAGKSGK
jgi:large subunit ribosomal protein L6